jgi:hypothetical protein
MTDRNYNKKIENAYNKEFMKKVDETSKTRGVAGTSRYEPLPGYISTQSEKVISNRNAFIVLGKDRNGSEISGQGGMGEVNCDSIEIVVGRKTATKKEQKDYDKRVDPDAIDDAAKIYITQKGNIDNYFGITTGTESHMTSDSKSGVAIKADHVRLFGREHIKIVTGQSENFGAKEDLNSLGKTIGKVGRIDFIAGNYNDFVSNPSKLQPLVKGENLVELQKELLETLQEIVGHITANTAEILSIWTTLGSFIAPATALSATPPVLTAFQTMCGAKSMYIGSAIIPAHKATTLGLSATRVNYLEVVDGSQYINSEHVFTT